MRTGNTNVTVEIACESHNSRLDKKSLHNGGYSTNIGKSKRVLASTIYYKYVFAKPYIRGITTNIGKL